jgi:hypothetical protein
MQTSCLVNLKTQERGNRSLCNPAIPQNPEIGAPVDGRTGPEVRGLQPGVVSSVTFLRFTSRMTTAFPPEISGIHDFSFLHVPERVQNLSGNSGLSSTLFRKGRCPQTNTHGGNAQLYTHGGQCPVTVEF